MAIFVIILTIFAFLSVVCVKNTLNILKNDAGYVVVLDAGHGAPDGGVVGTNTGVLESDLNLKMVKILQNYLENAGVKVVLTRKNKYALSGGAKGFKKEDFKLRKEIIESVNPDAVISIHMNFYKAQPSRRGAQVFYDAKNPYSLPFAATLMQKINTEINKKYSGREYAALSGDFYIINSTSAPAAIVECGFLSNAEDEKTACRRRIQKGILLSLVFGRDAISVHGRKIRASDVCLAAKRCAFGVIFCCRKAMFLSLKEDKVF